MWERLKRFDAKEKGKNLGCLMWEEAFGCGLGHAKTSKKSSSILLILSFLNLLIQGVFSINNGLVPPLQRLRLCPSLCNISGITSKGGKRPVNLLPAVSSLCNPVAVCLAIITQKYVIARQMFNEEQFSASLLSASIWQERGCVGRFGSLDWRSDDPILRPGQKNEANKLKY